LLPLAAPIAAPLAAQEEPDEDGPWALEGEVGASLFFGAAEQTTVTMRSALERATERLELSLGGGFAYGEGENPETGESFVNKRSWTTSLSADYMPEDRFSPFVFSSAEGSLERQIDLRVSGGAGGKLKIVRGERANLDVSLAALVERTDPRAVEGQPDEVDTKGRWSARLRADRQLAEGRVTFGLVTFYRPAFGDFDDYTVDLETSLGFELTEAVTLKISLVDTYDSLAEDRGAASNNDGRLFFSILATAG
jgi:hypothetical protein